MEVEGTVVRVATIEALYSMKRDTVRPKDKAVARLLLKLMQMIHDGKASGEDSRSEDHFYADQKISNL